MKALKSMGIAAVLAMSAMGVANANQFQSIPGVTGDVKVILDGGVATISGHLDSSFESQLAGKYVASADGVVEVINLVTFK